MEIKVKKSVLFNVLKQLMTESPSRSDYHIGGNMGGNFLGFFAEDEEPIKGPHLLKAKEINKAI